MKIGKKLLVVNLGITILAMIIISILVSLVVSGYIEDNYIERLKKSNERIVKWLDSGKFYQEYSRPFKIDPMVFKSISDEVVVPIIVKEYDGNSEIVTSEFINKILPDSSLIEQIVLNKENGLRNEHISNSSVIIYKSELESQREDGVTIHVYTFIFDNVINEMIKKTTGLLIGGIVIVLIISIIGTRIFERRITKPIEGLTAYCKTIGKENEIEIKPLDSNDEIEELSKAILMMKNGLRMKQKEQAVFYENVSHDLKTPLTVISGYAESLKEGVIKANDSVYDKMIQECQNVKQRLENIIYLSRFDEQKHNTIKKEVSVNEIMKKSLNHLENLFILKDIEIEYNMTTDVMILADDIMLIKLFENILTNALKYSESYVKVESKIVNEKIVIKIKDDGKGFSERVLENPFSRGKTDLENGSGIGLSISYNIVSFLLGEIEITNSANGGAIVEISFNIV